MAKSSSKRLIFRLSSLGDVVLASALLRDGIRSDWVCSREYADLLAGHPVLDRLFLFDRSQGLSAWLVLCARLARSGEYFQVVDLHGSLRTRIARVVWLFLSPRTPWKSVPKQRIRRWAYVLLKGALPAGLRPTLYLDRVGRLMSPSGQPGTDLSHLVSQSKKGPLGKEDAVFCVMPAARWPGKQWPATQLAQALQHLLRELGPRVRFEILGQSSDQASIELFQECERRGIAGAQGPVRFESGSLSLREVAERLAQARGYIGMDTGLAHLSEAVGTEAFMFFGPATPEFGFAPWRKGSRTTGRSLWCRPCGRDGRACFRISKRHACLTELTAAQVIPSLSQWARDQLLERR